MKLNIKRFEIWLANMDPAYGTEAGKVRPVAIIQRQSLNDNRKHLSTIVCPMTTNLKPKTSILRVRVKDGEANLNGAGDIMVDQITAIDNRRFRRKIGTLPNDVCVELTDALNIVLDLGD